MSVGDESREEAERERRRRRTGRGWRGSSTQRGNSLPFLKIEVDWTIRMMMIDFTFRNFQAAVGLLQNFLIRVLLKFLWR